MAAELDLDAVLQRIVDLAVDITGARYGALGVLDDDGAITRFVTAGITPEERASMGDPPTGHGVLGLLTAEERPMRIADLTHNERSSGFPPGHPPMRSFLGVPVRALGRVFGNIYLTEKRGASEFDEDDETTLTVLATQAGVAIENARLYAEMTHAQELRRLEVLEERERIAKELHDGVVQALFAVGMSLQGAAAQAGDPDIVARLENTVEDIDRTIRDLRNYIFGLRPGILADRQLDQALQELGVPLVGPGLEEPARSFIESQGDTRRPDEVPPGASRDSVANIQRLRRERIIAEAARLKAQYPITFRK